jgi:hypothetical protein
MGPSAATVHAAVAWSCTTTTAWQSAVSAVARTSLRATGIGVTASASATTVAVRGAGRAIVGAYRAASAASTTCHAIVTCTARTAIRGRRCTSHTHHTSAVWACGTASTSA